MSVARLAEGHLDAASIAAEAGTELEEDALYGVWASSGDVRFEQGRLHGTRPFGSGLGVIDRALVTARTGDGLGLFDVDVEASPSVEHLIDWHTPAMRSSRTGAVVFRAHPVRVMVGPPGWYLSRAGFWHGACGPAACWAGAVDPLIDLAADAASDDPHTQAHVGAMIAARWSVRGLLDRAGREIDLDPDDVSAAAVRALSLRHTVHSIVTDVLDRLARALGPRPFVGDSGFAQRHADVWLYLMQHHSERDLADLAARVAAERRGSVDS